MKTGPVSHVNKATISRIPFVKSV